MRILIMALFTLNSSLLTVKAQQPNLDSLNGVWQDQSQTDSIRAAAYGDYIRKGFLFSNPDSAFILAEELVVFGQEKQYINAQVNGYLVQGNIYKRQSNYPKAMEYYQRSLKIAEENGNKQGIAHSLNSIGIIYKRQSNYPKALGYFQRSLKIKEEIGDKSGIANALHNIGVIFHHRGDYPKAMDYFRKSLKIMEELGDKKGISYHLIHTGIIYMKQGAYPKAMDCFQKSLKILEELGDKYGIANSLNNLGSLYQELGDDQKAINQCSKGLLLAQEIGSVSFQRDACQCLYDAYKSMGNSNKALGYHEQMLVLDDSLNAKETNNQLQRFEFDRKILEADIEREKDKREQQVAHQKEITQKNKIQYTVIGLAALIMLVAIGLFARLRFTNKTNKIIEKEKYVAETERSRSDELLLNILPADVAEELKNTGASEAKHFDEVSILFTDFKGFTQVSELLSAKDLVNEINTCFKAFDNICEKYGIEKIKTIGDAYMAAGGLPVLSDDSIKNTALAALEMQAFITQRKGENDASNKAAFEMRVGIHTGPVVAGIVGIKKFQYDIWGDTVNTASRMESADEIGKVNISQATYELLKDDADFSFESRGKIEAKGKGEMEMYFVSVKKE